VKNMFSNKMISKMLTVTVIMAVYVLLILFINPGILSFHRDPILFEEDIRIFVYTFPLLAVIIAGYICFCERRVFLEVMRSVPKRYFITLGITVIIFLLVCCWGGLTLKFFNPTDAEWAELHYARDLVTGDKRAFLYLIDRVMGILIYAIGFKVFGFTPFVGTITSLVVGALSIVAVFFLAQVLFRNPRISLASGMVYAANPHVLIFSSVRMGYTIIVGLFMLLFIIAAVLAFRRHSFPLHIVALACFAVMNQTKPEYFVLIGVYAFCYLLFGEFRHLSWRRTAVLCLVLFLFSIPFLLTNYHFRQTTMDGWCSFPSQPFHDGRFYSYFSPVLAPMDVALRFLLNNRFSLNYFFNDIPSFISFWGSLKMVIISVVAMVGFLLSFKKHFRDNLFLFLSFVIMSFIYLADCIYYEDRLAVPTYNIAVLYVGFAIGFLADSLTRFIGKGEISRYISVIIISLAVSLVSLGVAFKSYRSYLGERLLPHSLLDLSSTYSVDIYGDLRSISDKYGFAPAQSYLILPGHAELHSAQFLGYEAIALSDMFDSSFFTDRDLFLGNFQLPHGAFKNNYFIESPQCSPPDQELGVMCEFVKINYKERMIGQWGVYTIYQLK